MRFVMMMFQNVPKANRDSGAEETLRMCVWFEWEQQFCPIPIFTDTRRFKTIVERKLFVDIGKCEVE